jgi:hypothetical protein
MLWNPKVRRVRASVNDAATLTTDNLAGPDGIRQEGAP